MKKFFIILVIFLFAGCGTLPRIEPQTLLMEEVLIEFYANRFELRSDFYDLYPDEIIKNGELRGFYSPELNSIHCVKWDFYCLGHEMMHALDYVTEDPHLLVEKNRLWHFNVRTTSEE